MSGTTDPNLVTIASIPGSCPAIQNSSGYSALVKGTCSGRIRRDGACRGTWTCTYNTELIDSEDSVNQFITEFIPGFTSIADENGKCQGQSTPLCPLWGQINTKILAKYCQNISTFSAGSGGECTNYERNPFNPFLPKSKGCNNITNSNSICNEWMNANFDQASALYTSTVDSTQVNYCERVPTPDCACIAAERSAVYQEITDKGISGDNRCWWRPCESSSQNTYLIKQPGGAGKCDEAICIDVNNIFFGRDDAIGGDVVIDQLNACGKAKPSNTKWYEQWWVWIIVLAVAVIVFAVFIYFASKT